MGWTLASSDQFNMKIRLKLDKDLTKEELLARLPSLAKSMAEAILEKGSVIGKRIDDEVWESHPVRAIARAEDDLYHQGSDCLAGVYSWLIRRLKLSEVKKGGVDKDSFRDEVLEEHGVKLGQTIDFDQAKEIDEVLDLIPSEVYEDAVRLISVDGRFGSSKRKYPNHGRYYQDDQKIILNPQIFDEKTDYKDGAGKPISKIKHTLLHETGHAIDDKNGLSDTKEWRSISGWKYIGDEEPAEDHERLVLEDAGAPTLKGKWQYKKGTCFPRWYGARNPKEDFCESFVFALLGAEKLFIGESGKAKLAFVKKVIDKLVKSENPCQNLEKAEDTEILESQLFKSYCDSRLPCLNETHDELEAVATAKSEFSYETCEDLHLTKAEGDAPAPAPEPSAPAPSGGAGAGAGAGDVGQSGGLGQSPLKGREKPGHKYLYREPRPDGSFTYYYKLPDGKVFSHDQPLHPEGMEPHFGEHEDFSAHMDKLPEGHFIETPTKEHLEQTASYLKNPIMHDIKPSTDMFAGMSEAQRLDAMDILGETAQVRLGDNDKVSMSPKDLPNTSQNRDQILRHMSEKPISDFDPAFVVKAEKDLGYHASKPMKVSLEDDGDAIIKPEEGGAEETEHFPEFSGESVPHREHFNGIMDDITAFGLVPPTTGRKLTGTDAEKLGVAFRKLYDIPGVKTEGMFVSVQKFIHGSRVWGDFMVPVKSQYTPGGKVSPPGQVVSKDPDMPPDWDVRASGSGPIRDLEPSPEGKKILDEMEPERLKHMLLHDMIISNLDRNHGNMIVAPDPDTGKMQIYLIDNGYSLGNGVEVDIRLEHELQRRTRGTPLSDKTVESLKRLRDIIKDPKARREHLTDGIMRTIPHDQIMRVAHRIDFILGKDNPANKTFNAGRKAGDQKVYVPRLDDIENWESNALPLREYAGDPKDRDKFEAYGDGGPMRSQEPKDLSKTRPWRNAGDIRKFFAPISDRFSPRQKAKFEAALDADLFRSRLRDKDDNKSAIVVNRWTDFLTSLPRSIVSQLHRSHSILDRLGLQKSAFIRENLTEAIDNHLKTNGFSSLLKEIRMRASDQSAQERFANGQMTADELRKIIGHDSFEKHRDHGSIPFGMAEEPKLSGVEKFEESQSGGLYVALED